jgi:RNA polymerase sigma-70 factor (ECF subfamily)
VPKLAQYAGRAPLGAWLRVVAARLASRAAADEREQPADDRVLEQLAAAGAGPELAYIKAAYRPALARAFVDALAALSLHERLLLRQQTIDGLGIDAIGRLHRVHRATAARWVARARDKLLAGTRGRLGEALGLPAGELDEVIGLVRSQLEVSLRRLL